MQIPKWLRRGNSAQMKATTQSAVSQHPHSAVRSKAAKVRWAASPDRPFPSDAIVDAEFMPAVVRYTWRLNTNGYYFTRVRRKPVSLHRFVWQQKFGAAPKELDHINRNRRDCRIANLRPATRSMNTCGTGRAGRTLPRGVSKRYDGLYEVRFRSQRIGYFASASEASQGYERALREYVKEQEIIANAEYFSA